MNKAEKAITMAEEMTYGAKKTKKIGKTTYTGDKYRSGDWVAELSREELEALASSPEGRAEIDKWYKKARETGDEVEAQKYMAMAVGKTARTGYTIGLKVVAKERKKKVENWDDITDASNMLDQDSTNVQMQFDQKIESSSMFQSFYKDVEKKFDDKYVKMFTYLLFKWEIISDLVFKPPFYDEVKKEWDKMIKEGINPESVSVSFLHLFPELTINQCYTIYEKIENYIKVLTKKYGLGR